MIFVYIALGPQYIAECLESILSMRGIGQFGGDIVVVTDQEVDPGSLDFRVVTLPKITGRAMGAGEKIRFFEHAEAAGIQIGKRPIAFLDSDMLALRRIDTAEILRHCARERVNFYGYPERDQSYQYMAGLWTDDPTIIQSKGFCSGFMLAYDTPTIREAFDEMYQLYQKLLKRRNRKVCRFWDQPFLSYHLLRRELVCVGLDLLFVEERDGNREDYKRAMFCHFLGRRSEARAARMRKVRKRLQRGSPTFDWVLA